MVKLALVCVLVVACDSNSGHGTDFSIDAPPGTPMCTKAVYDLCMTDDQCTSGMCHAFESFSVCTQACSSSNPCPADKTGAPGSCNNRGICKPAEPTVCIP